MVSAIRLLARELPVVGVDRPPHLHQIRFGRDLRGQCEGCGPEGLTDIDGAHLVRVVALVALSVSDGDLEVHEAGVRGRMVDPAMYPAFSGRPRGG